MLPSAALQTDREAIRRIALVAAQQPRGGRCVAPCLTMQGIHLPLACLRFLSGANHGIR